MDETWKQIPGLKSGYEASDLGRIRFNGTILPTRMMGQHAYPIVSVPIKDQVGYPFNKRTATFCRVHELVLLAWHGHRLRSTNIPIFRDGDRTNVTAGNLRWGQRRAPRVIVTRAPLSIKVVLQILRLADQGLRPGQIYDAMGKDHSRNQITRLLIRLRGLIVRTDGSKLITTEIDSEKRNTERDGITI